MIRKHFGAYHILSLLSGAALIGLGIVGFVLRHAAKSFMFPTLWNYIAVASAGIGFFAIAFQTKTGSTISLAAFAFAAALGFKYQQWTNTPSSAVLGVVFSVACIYGALFSLRSLYREAWRPLIRFAAFLTPRNWKSQYRLANSYYMARKMNEASQIIQRARKRMLPSLWFDYLEAAICLGRNELEGAKSLLERVIASDMPIPKAFLFRGICFYRLEHYDAAISDISLWISDHPDDEDALFYRGVSFDMAGNYPSAIADYSLLLKGNNQRADVFFNRGLCEQKLNNLDSAIADWTYATRCKVPDPKAFVSLGEVAYEASDNSTAIDMFRKAYQIDASLRDRIPTEILSQIEAEKVRQE
jgi:tetratricopeptide (TPR) repeat protein